MKIRMAIGGLLAAVTLVGVAQAQTLASTMEVYVFPTEGQNASRQSIDEAGCYDWAVDNTKTDPFKLARADDAATRQAQAEQEAAEAAAKGTAVKGAARGAAAGAVIGEVADDAAGKGAKYGAAAGAVRGRVKSRRTQQQAEQEASEAAARREEATAEQLERFRKAFSVCLEAKDYLVKY
jgi:hypothetical protein